jgi:hypothetical protein
MGCNKPGINILFLSISISVKGVFMVKRLLLLSVVLASLSFGGEGYAVDASYPQVTSPESYTNDTLLQFKKRSKGLVGYNFSTGTSHGPIFGNGVGSQGYQNFTGAGQVYDAIGNFNVVEVLFLAFKKVIVDDPNSFSVFVNKVNVDTTVGGQVGSGVISMQNITTGPTPYNSVKLTESVSTDNQRFIVSLQWGTTMNDTIGLLSNRADSADGKGENRARVKMNPIFVGVEWAAARSKVSPTFDCDVMIIPVIEKSTGVGDAQIPGSLKDFSGFVSSSGKTIIVAYSLRSAQNVSVKIFDISGKALIQTTVHIMNAGDHQVRVELKNKAAGNYYYTITAGAKSFTGRICLVK